MEEREREREREMGENEGGKMPRELTPLRSGTTMTTSLKVEFTAAAIGRKGG
jgi:hypothetical protein